MKIEHICLTPQTVNEHALYWFLIGVIVTAAAAMLFSRIE
jgi:hypothetical protein